jgi:hypothetical protein
MDNTVITKIKNQYPGDAWTTQELSKKFEVLGFSAPFVSVIRKEDRAEGTLEFLHSPRIYYRFIKK